MTRVIVEVTAAAVAVGGIVIARTQSGTVDLYASAAPVLVAVLAVIVILRLYQVLLRALARASARRRGVVGFVGLTRASAATVTFALLALTLVLASPPRRSPAWSGKPWPAARRPCPGSRPAPTRRSPPPGR